MKALSYDKYEEKRRRRCMDSEGTPFEILLLSMSSRLFTFIRFLNVSPYFQVLINSAEFFSPHFFPLKGMIYAVRYFGIINFLLS